MAFADLDRASHLATRAIVLECFERALAAMRLGPLQEGPLRELTHEPVVRLFAVGKAAGVMAEAAFVSLGDRIRAALVVCDAESAPFTHERASRGRFAS